MLFCAMTYRETLDFLFSQLPAYHRIGKAAYKNNLDNTLMLDEHLNHPHLRFRSVHVAGTNGKGSVSHMIASVFMEAGYRTGLYTSPHLVDFRERIRVNGEMIPEQEVIAFVESYRSVIESIKPSFFEMTVGMAFDFFARSGVEVAVIEVGLGGRLDSTNIITPELSVITNIGHDHMDLLGNTFEKIAAEKAGIIKEGVPVVISETQKETEPVFISVANAKHSEIIFADKTFSCSLEPDHPSGERQYTLNEMSTGKSIKGYTPLGGDYQAHNIPAVYAAFRALEGHFSISLENIREGIGKVITNTGLNGRWQVRGINPLIICDTGHNKEGLEYVTAQLSKIRKRKLHMVIGFVNDKDLSLVLPLLPSDAVFYFTKASVARALDENILKSKALDFGLMGESYPDVKSALAAAKSDALPEDVIFVGGSTFVVADFLSV